MRRCALPFLFCVLAGCGPREASVPPEAREAMALLAEMERLAEPPPAPRAADSVDVMQLVTDAEIAAILARHGAAGTSQPGSFSVRQERTTDPRAPGYGTARDEVQWIGKDTEGNERTRGSFALRVVELPVFRTMALLEGGRIEGLGDEALDVAGVPWMRVGDIALVVENNSAMPDLARDILAVAAPRLR